MATFALTVTITATNAEIAKTILGLEQRHARIQGETDLQFAKRIWAEYLKECYKTQKIKEAVESTVSSTPTDIDIS